MKMIKEDCSDSCTGIHLVDLRDGCVCERDLVTYRAAALTPAKGRLQSITPL